MKQHGRDRLVRDELTKGVGVYLPESLYARLKREANGVPLSEWIRQQLLERLSAAAVVLVVVLLPALASAQTVVIDHTNLQARFSALTAARVTELAGKRVLFIDRSVGDNIHIFLACMGHFDNPGQATGVAGWNYCNRAHSVESWILAGDYWWWSRKYPDAHITYSQWDAICSGVGYWYDVISCALGYASAHLADFDVLAFTHSYLEVSGDITSTTTGYFVQQSGRSDVTDIEAWLTANPTKSLIWMTPPISRAQGSALMQEHLAQYRQYALSRNGGVFLDLADIQSHAPYAYPYDAPCYDNRDGVPYVVSATKQENYPDDGTNYEAICQWYTTEVDGGHLASVAAGGVRAAKAFWAALDAVAQSGGAPPSDVTPPAATCVWTAPNLSCVITDNSGVQSIRVMPKDLSGNESTTVIP